MNLMNSDILDTYTGIPIVKNKIKYTRKGEWIRSGLKDMDTQHLIYLKMTKCTR